MEATKHTPGPWQFAPGRFNAEPILGSPGTVTDGEWIVCTIEGVGSDSNPPDAIDREYEEMTLANARLIAAAPDLLAAAKEVLEGLNERIDAAPPEAKPVFIGIVNLWHAINKAEGKE
jgi:hypothetical protein